ncbi:TIGR02444 family protein [Pseudomonas brassicacearum]|jgi:uncharacterized protein (TIGR02444 family)|uniref:TIGR02444 family protein n=1 Tax=Pseudomonas brassicacearum subsp. neoaurantiaca TaxID=494916 RepID=A0A7V8RKZ0_9PSED|nr:TIGR02444 family protein [Pseudomonas brassicacearum]MBA1378404.1 TIGR02444 family protein [Pseudomonas brassicacearum subsp. neoaurantiaca]
MSSDLWSFSLDLYAKPGVEPACLALQAAGTNVCLVLCGLWLEQRGVTFDEQRLEQLRNLAEPWDQHVVQPLRALRIQWKEAALKDARLNGLREQIKRLELEAERQLLEQLETVAKGWPKERYAGAGRWLQSVAGKDGQLHRDALHQLRVAVSEA